jgi:hypothetical protein
MKLKGTSVVAILDYVEAKHGEEARQQLVAALPQSEREQVETGVLSSAWISASLVETLLTTGEALFRDPGFSAGAGRHLAEFGTKGVYKAMLKDGGPSKTLKTLPTMWHVYCERGDISVDFPSDTECVMTVTQFPASAPLCRRLAGYFQRLVELSGGVGVNVVPPINAKEGDPLNWRLTWK